VCIPRPASDSNSKLAGNTHFTALTASDVVLDAIFGLASPSTPVRSPFDVTLLFIVRTSLPIVSVVSVDIPSGWSVERGEAASYTDAGGTGMPGRTCQPRCAEGGRPEVHRAPLSRRKIRAQVSV